MITDIPKTLEEAFEYMKQFDEGLADFQMASENNAMGMSHHCTGTWIRNNWGFWSRTGELYNYLRDLGLHHPDDMSGLILRSFHRHLNNRALNITAQVDEYKKYWEDKQ